MTYFEQALQYLELEVTSEARRYLDYAKECGSPSEKEQAIRLLDALQNGHTSDATDFARRYSREDGIKPVFTGEYEYTHLHRESYNLSVADLLADKRYLEALSELKKREAKATPEELYYLGILHDDFGMGMPNDRSKARIYLFTSWTAGYVKAGVRYVMSYRDKNEEGDFRLNAEQKKILELAEEKGDLEAEILLFVDEAKQKREGVAFEEAKKMFEELLLRLREWQEIEEIPFLDLFLFEFDSDSDDPEIRERAFKRLLAVSEHWDTFYSSIALETIATCYRDGTYVFQDFEKAKEYFRKVVGLNKCEVCSSAQEFLSGEWQEAPDEDFEA
ncbi:MAG: hypothetical protein IJW12_07770, partial [Opitutales bacterium]|nr:hypothetical protein [Opitutales bacterium]